MPMNKLIKAGLFGRGLVRIDRPPLVDRYNECLVDMGLPATKLSTFQIDKMGWSPEIAEEQGDNYYLSHGEANPLAIIITPLQEQAPIYFPMHSFDWGLMDQWFKLFRIPIADITRDTGIWLDIDNEVDIYSRPSDLLMVSEVFARVNCPGGLIARAQEQHKLVQRWLTEPSPHADDQLIRALEKTAIEDGDLRRRHLLITDMPYLDILDFYSRAFGGTFVLRSQGTEPMVLVRVEAKQPLMANEYRATLDVLPRLIESGYVETDAAWWKDHLFRLKVVAESFLVEVLDAHEPELAFEELKDARKRQLVDQYQSELEMYNELTRARAKLKTGVVPEVSPEVQIHLMHPADHLSQGSRELVWQLLTYLQGGRFVPLFYRHQKTAFVEAFTKSWRTPRQTWALGRISEHYDLASKSSGLDL